MKIAYDRHSDTLVIKRRDVKIAESDEVQPDVIVDYDDEGNLAGLEILDVSRHLESLPLAWPREAV